MKRSVCMMLVTAVVGCGGTGGLLGGGVDQSSPETLFQSALRTCAEPDLETCLGLIDEADRDQFVFNLLVGLSLAAFTTNIGVEFEEIAKKHGISELKPGEEAITIDSSAAMKIAAERAMKNVGDKAGLLSDLVALARRQDAKNKTKPVASDTPSPTLTDLSVDGDAATATVGMHGRQEPVLFVRRAGRWYLRGQSGAVALSLVS